MKAKDIKVGHIYYVDFEPARKGEFNKYHMALVLKKTINEITFIVVPLTSNDKGIGENKIKIDIKTILPSNLQEKETYAVYDQIRTLNASRFHNLIEDGNPIDVSVTKETIDLILENIINCLIGDLEITRKRDILNNLQ